MSTAGMKPIPPMAVVCIALIIGSAAFVSLPLTEAAQKSLLLTAGQDPAVSPDGKTLAFSRWVEGNCDLYLASIEGTSKLSPPRRFTTDAALDRSPAWSPDGKKICFVSTRAGNKDLWVADLEHPDSPRQLTLGNAPDEDPAWSPDGALIAYVSRAMESIDIFVVPAAGGEPVRLTEDRFDDAHPTWSRDGRRIAFASSRNDTRNIWMIDVGALSEAPRSPGGGAASGFPYHIYQLTRAEGEHIADDSDPAWCPGDDVIAFSSDRRSELPTVGRPRQRPEMPRGIYFTSTGPMPIVTVGVTHLGILEQPAWMPGGRDLVYVRGPFRPTKGSKEESMIWMTTGVRK